MGLPAARYRFRIWSAVRELLEPHATFDTALDLGSGDGWFAGQVQSSGLARKVVPVDVLRRKNTVVEPVIYDGGTLPFEHRSFDLCYAIDALHHVDDPFEKIRDLARCT